VYGKSQIKSLKIKSQLRGKNEIVEHKELKERTWYSEESLREAERKERRN
jgi:hypothetical protein